LSHQGGKKIPNSNAIQFQSHQRKKKNGVWRQLCECLSEATAHLPPTVSQLMLQALFIADLSNELYTHLAPQALFSVLLDTCSFCFLQYTALPACCNSSPFLFRVRVVRCPSPNLQWSVPHFSRCWTPSPLQAHWGRWRHTCLLWPACSPTVCVGQCPFPHLRWSCPHNSHCYKLSPIQGGLVGITTPAFSGWLVYLQFA
jgi:hypothetical protein